MNFKNLFSKKKKNTDNKTDGIEILPKLWDEYAAVYEKSFGKISVFQGFAKKLREYLVSVPGGMVLDGGCGPGLHFEKIIQATNPSKLVGLDFSSRMLEEANKTKEKLSRKYECQIDLKKVDLCKGISFPDNTFDAQIYHLVLYYLPSGEWKNVLREAFRVAKPGGYVITTNVLKRFDFKKEMGVLGILREMIFAPVATLLFVLKVKPIFMKFQDMEREGVLSYPSREELFRAYKEIGFQDVVFQYVWKDNMIMIRAHKPQK